MTGLKSGSGDDLWGDDGDDGDDSTDDADATNARAKAKENEEEANDDEAAEGATDPVAESEPSDQSAPDTESRADVGASTDGTAETGTTDTTAASESTDSDNSVDAAGEVESTEGDGESSAPSIDLSSVDGGSAGGAQSYIVRRAVQDKSVQFERDERLTFFVHDDVADGERDLVTSLQSALGRDVPKFDVREAVYRAALRNPDDVLEELLKMGYSVDEE